MKERVIFVCGCLSALEVGFRGFSERMNDLVHGYFSALVGFRGF